MAGGHFLQAVIAYCGSCAQRGFDVAFFEKSSLLRGMRPDAREAVRLEFEAHRRGIRAVHAASLRFLFDAQNILNVVSDLVGKHVGLSEFTWRAKAPLQLIVKT